MAPVQSHELFLKTWNLDDFLKECPSQAEEATLRLLMTSDGTMTRALEAVHLFPITVEMIKQSQTHLDPEVAGYLEIRTPPKEVVSRKVWLKKGPQKMLYASTILAIQAAQTGEDRLEAIREAILAGCKPLGSLIEQYRLPSFKDKIMIGTLLYPEVAQDFGLSPATELWGRHYRLAMGSCVRASVLEVFSPAAFCSNGMKPCRTD